MASKKKPTDVAVVEETSTALAAPSFMKKGTAGTENLGQQDIELPSLKLLQGTSPGLNENGWRAGNFLHSILEQEIPGAEGLRITPIIALKPRYVLFNPLDQGGGILARALDGIHWSVPNHEFKVRINKGTKDAVWKTADTVAKSGLDKFGSSDIDNPNSTPAADLQYQYICVSPDFPEFGAFIMLLQRSGIRSAKRLNALIMNTGYDAYALEFNLTSQWEDKGPDDKKFLWNFKPGGFVKSEDRYKQNENLYTQFKDADVSAHDEESAVPESTTDAEPAKDDGEF